MKHLDLFSGIGGFSLAVDRVWHEEENEHIFVEYDPFCQAVLKKHWPKAEYHKDIRQFVEDTKRERQLDGEHEKPGSVGNEREFSAGDEERVHLLTGGFPCQPFSQAGRRKGTADDRYLWPPMLECVTLFRPEWVIAENVAGLVTWNDGLVLETVCSDLEAQGYEVQPFVIPAVAVGAPHRRDRVWIVAHAKSERRRTKHRDISSENGRPSKLAPELRSTDTDAPDTRRKRWSAWASESVEPSSEKSEWTHNRNRDWDANWIEVAARLCRVDDGVPRRLDRNPRLKALGNAIVPQVAEETMRAIKQSNDV